MKSVRVFISSTENVEMTSSKATLLTQLLCITRFQQYFLWYFMEGKVCSFLYFPLLIIITSLLKQYEFKWFYSSLSISFLVLIM